MFRSFFQRFMPAVLLLLLGVLLAAYLVPQELEMMKWEVPGMPESYPIEQQMRPILLLVLCFIPFIGGVVYGMMGTMDRYVSRVFINYFLLCTLILLLIYTLADFTANMDKFRTQFDNPLMDSLLFYGSQMPMFLYQILPYTLLMGALWSLSRLSATSEITGMLQSGRSLLRLCMPVFFFAALASLVYGIFGFHWAPSGFLYRDIMLKQKTQLTGAPVPIVYRSDSEARIWRIGEPATFANPGKPMKQVIIEQFDPQVRGRMIKQYLADSASWDKESSSWTLSNVYVRPIASDANRPVDEEHHDKLVCQFDEKPYQIISPAMGGSVESMSITVMYDILSSGAGSRENRLAYRTEWHVRIARVFTCMVLVLLAVPSAVTFQRRGAMKGIGIAVLLAALMLFLYRVFPALGISGLVQAWISAWIPNAVYLAVALYLFRQNLSHRSFAEWVGAKLHGRP